MLKPRIIPCLLVHKGGLVKTVRFENPRYVGDPINAVKVFNEKLVDEIMVIDIDASVERREPSYALIERFAAEARMPVCYAGGVQSVDQVKRIVSLGVEKVGISSAAIEQPGFIRAAAAEVGSQSVVGIIDAKQASNGTYVTYTHNGKRMHKLHPVQHAQALCRDGIGELVIYSVDRDGTQLGYDLHLIELIKGTVDIPVTALGGAGSVEDFKSLISKFPIIGAAAGDIFVFKGKFKAVLLTYPSKAEKDEIFESAASGAEAEVG